RHRIEGDASRVFGGCHDWRERERRRRNDHMQLRRQDEKSDDHRRRSVYRKRLPAGGASDDWKRRLRRQRDDGPRKRPVRIARRERREAAELRGLGRQEEDEGRWSGLGIWD